MLQPKFENAQYFGAVIGSKEYCKYIFRIIIKCLIKIIIFLAALCLTFIFFNLVVPKNHETGGFDSLSVGAALVTFFSAMISLLSLADSECMKKYESNLYILESRYLDNQKVSGWDFLQRRSYNHNDINYCITSAFFTLYAGNNPEEKFTIVIPALSMDMTDVHCIREIYRLKEFAPKFLKYLLNEKNSLRSSKDNDELSKNDPIYYITLPNHISALYQNVLKHKMIQCATMFCLIFLICAIILTIIYPLITSITM